MRLLKKTHHEWASTHQSIRELRLQSLIKGADFLVFVTSVNKSLVLRGKNTLLKLRHYQTTPTLDYYRVVFRKKWTDTQVSEFQSSLKTLFSYDGPTGKKCWYISLFCQPFLTFFNNGWEEGIRERGKGDSLGTFMEQIGNQFQSFSPPKHG